MNQSGTASPTPAAHRQSSARVKFRSDPAFQTSLAERVERYFRMTGQSPRDCRGMYRKTAIVLAWLMGSYLLLVFWAPVWWLSVPAAISLGLAIAAVGFNVQHDGNHGAYSRRPWINRLMASTLDLIGGSSYVWSHKHNTIHHTYANINGHDDDINVGPLARLAPDQRWHWWHRAQHWYVWILYAGLAVKWQLWDDYRDVIRGRIGQHRFARPTGMELAIFLAGKGTSLALAFAVPALVHSFGWVILFYLLVSGVSGVTLAVVFQLAHVVEGAEFPMPDTATGRIDRPWAIHQVETTVDFARGNRVVSWLLGGLNYQIEHHLFPRVCHVHYSRISRIVESACRRFGIRYREHRTVIAGIVSHFRWLRSMARRPNAAPS